MGGGGDTDDDDTDDYANDKQGDETDDWMLLWRINEHYEQYGTQMFQNTTESFETLNLFQ